MALTVEPLTGGALEDALPDLARLRIAVFRAWPYLYEGDDAYERDYIRRYAESPGAVVVAARDGATIVGAATAAPMEDHAAELAAPLAAAGCALTETLYCGESVLLPSHRGRGIGHAFFDAREAHGRALGRTVSCFCAVIRDPADPRRPPDYTPLDPFWRKRGYAPVEGAEGSYAWREIGAAEETAHPMRMWLRRL
jgi:GNAT superfamily N-acetyltransferase